MIVADPCLVCIPRASVKLSMIFEVSGVKSYSSRCSPELESFSRPFDL